MIKEWQIYDFTNELRDELRAAQSTLVKLASEMVNYAIEQGNRMLAGKLERFAQSDEPGCESDRPKRRVRYKR